MNRDDITRMAREAAETTGTWTPSEWNEPLLERFAALVAAAEREKVAKWMIQRGYATGHGDTTEDLLVELDWQFAESLNRELLKGSKIEREACAKVVEEWLHGEWHNQGVIAALMIRERGAP